MVSVEKKPNVAGVDWYAGCDDGSFVVFSRVVTAGERIIYSAYNVDDDTVTTYGYISDIQEPKGERVQK